MKLNQIINVIVQKNVPNPKEIIQEKRKTLINNRAFYCYIIGVMSYSVVLITSVNHFCFQPINSYSVIQINKHDGCTKTSLFLFMVLSPIYILFVIQVIT